MTHCLHAFPVGCWHTFLPTQWERGISSHHTLFLWLIPTYFMTHDCVQLGFSRDRCSAFKCLHLSQFTWFEPLLQTICSMSSDFSVFKLLPEEQRSFMLVLSQEMCTTRIYISPLEEQCWYKSMLLLLKGVGIWLFSSCYYFSVCFLEQTWLLGVVN